MCRPLVAEIELPEGVVLEVGKPRTEVEQLEGKAYKASAPYGWTADATRERTKVEWVVRGPAGVNVKLTARHDRAGVVRAQVTLPAF